MFNLETRGKLLVVLLGDCLSLAIFQFCQFRGFIYIFFSLTETPSRCSGMSAWEIRTSRRNFGRLWWTDRWALWSIAKPSHKRLKIGVWLIGENDLASGWISPPVNPHQSTSRCLEIHTSARGCCQSRTHALGLPGIHMREFARGWDLHNGVRFMESV